MRSIKYVFLFLLCLFYGCLPAFSAELGYYPPVQRYYELLLEKTPELQAYEAELNKTREEFYAVFSSSGEPSSKKMASEWYNFQRVIAQQALENYLDKDDDFIREQTRQRYLLDYMRRVTILAKAPDGRLQYLLSRMNPYANDFGEKSYQNAKDVLVNVAALWDKEAGSAQAGDKAFTIRWDFGADDYSEEQHSMAAGPDGVYYGYNSFSAWDKDGEYEGIVPPFSRVQGGSISFLIFPDLPRERDFFLNPPPAEQREVWDYPKSDMNLCACKMDIRYQPVAAGDFSRLQAELYQTNSASVEPAYLCTPQCELVYELEGQSYSLRDKICKSTSEWGASPYNAARH